MPRRRRRGAFTLIEAVFALAVVAVAVAWLVSASQYAADASAAASNRTRAVTLGAGLAERMQLEGLAGWALQGAFAEAPGFRWEAEVRDSAADDAAINCREVVLSVLYPGAGYEEGRVELRFLVAGG